MACAVVAFVVGLAGHGKLIYMSASAKCGLIFMQEHLYLSKYSLVLIKRKGATQDEKNSTGSLKLKRQRNAKGVIHLRQRFKNSLKLPSASWVVWLVLCSIRKITKEQQGISAKHAEAAILRPNRKKVCT